VGTEKDWDILLKMATSMTDVENERFGKKRENLPKIAEKHGTYFNFQPVVARSFRN